MSRPQTIRLRKSETPAPKGAKIIDAEFEVVGRRTVWKRVRLALVTMFWAAVIGFAIPQIWLFSQSVGVYFAAR